MPEYGHVMEVYSRIWACHGGIRPIMSMYKSSMLTIANSKNIVISQKCIFSVDINN